MVTHSWVRGYDPVRLVETIRPSRRLTLDARRSINRRFVFNLLSSGYLYALSRPQILFPTISFLPYEMKQVVVSESLLSLGCALGEGKNRVQGFCPRAAKLA
jgi:hypothetical protein